MSARLKANGFGRFRCRGRIDCEWAAFYRMERLGRGFIYELARGLTVDTDGYMYVATELGVQYAIRRDA